MNTLCSFTRKNVLSMPDNKFWTICFLQILRILVRKIPIRNLDSLVDSVFRTQSHDRATPFLHGPRRCDSSHAHAMLFRDFFHALGYRSVALRFLASNQNADRSVAFCARRAPVTPGPRQDAARDR